MSSTTSKLRLVGALAALVTLALAMSCRGFFVNQPSSVTVNPNSQSLTSGQTQPFTATAAFSNNTSKDVTTSATWSTSNPCIVAIIASGTDAGHAVDVGTGGSATITASFNGIVGTATASVSPGLTISPCLPQQDVAGSPTIVFHVNQANVVFSATGATGAVTWSADKTNIATINSSTGAATFVSTGTATIMGSDTTNSGTLFITVQ